ncbi:MAG TPA: HD domain-containing protein [Longimicrobiaceae bacterium]|nr:HD domain-containing protein [Longimicrobiaceae bacterium]
MTETLTPAEARSTHGRTLDERFANRLLLNVPTRANAKVAALVERINRDEELYALWLAANVNAVERLGMTDHGPVHVKIVMNIAVKLLRVLTEHGVEPGVVEHYGMTNDEAEVVVVLGALLHDVGMSIHRTDHEGFSLFVAQAKVRELLDGIYDVRAATVLRAEVLHAIIAHRSGGRPLTIEAGVVRVADALDMAKGRSRIPFAAGSTSIHSISAQAIEAVHIESGVEKPVRLRIEMSNSAGVFQLDQLFREKLAGSGLERFVELEAQIEGESEKRLVTSFHL